MARRKWPDDNPTPRVAAARAIFDAGIKASMKVWRETGDVHAMKPVMEEYLRLVEQANPDDASEKGSVNLANPSSQAETEA